MRNAVLVLAAAVSLAGCYHATIETGLTPSNQRIEKKWASAWVYGLVPPSAVETMQRCPDGVARVDTQLSFTNQLVNFLTFGIYTPMEIVVTCAAAGGADGIDDSLVDNAADFSRALKVGAPFYVDLR